MTCIPLSYTPTRMSGRDQLCSRRLAAPHSLRAPLVLPSRTLALQCNRLSQRASQRPAGSYSHPPGTLSFKRRLQLTVSSSARAREGPSSAGVDEAASDGSVPWPPAQPHTDAHSSSQLGPEPAAGAAIEEAPQSAGTGKVLPFVDVGGYEGLHKPVGLVLSSAYVLGTAVQLSGVAMAPVWLPVLAGGALGGLYAALNRLGMKRFWRSPRAPLNVVITGGARGIGKALAREFLRSGDNVFITSRTAAGVQEAVAALREEVGPGVRGTVAGTACDVSCPASVEALAAAAQAHLGTVDVWISNAGYSGSFQTLLDASPSQIERVVRTNMLGVLLCTRVALRIMQSQPSGGHIFNMDGAGADGMATPQYAAYGATKAGIAQLYRSMQHETAGLDGPVAVHNLSPGMVLTDLLLEGTTDANKQIFNILCEHPETVAAFLVPRARTVVARGLQGQYIRYLTLGRALLRFLSAPLRTGRFFNEKGEAVYLPERERLLGQRAKRTERLAARAARRSHALGLAYSLSIAASYLLFIVDGLQRVHHGASCN